jgi:hypothetical protein
MNLLGSEQDGGWVVWRIALVDFGVSAAQASHDRSGSPAPDDHA